MRVIAVGVVVTCVCFTAAVGAWQARQPAGPLRIVVLEGEDAVNIIQQKTAVRPMVEVRDANNLPVAGATVVFTIQQGGGAARAAAFANGRSAFTVTTDAAGRAASGPLRALGSGALRIEVQASYQGQAATATITQTNFATAAEAAQAGRSVSPGGGSSAAGGGGAPGGGALSTAGTIAGIGAAAVGGALAVDDATSRSCTSDSDAAFADIQAAVEACGNRSSPQCTTAGQRAATSLGAWCSCDGRENVDAALRREGASLAVLIELAGIGNVAFPASCR